MKRFTSLLILLLAGAASAVAQTTIAKWTFETSIPATAGPFAPEIGSGSATGFHSGTTVYSNPVGNGSAESFSSTNWLVGDYYQFQTSTLGYSGISISFDQTSSSTGPKDFKLAYSTNGTTFSDFANYTVLQNGSPNPAWNSTTSSTAYGYAFDLSAIIALNNSANVYFRLVDTSTVSTNGGTVASSGTDRVDNFTVTAIPEPSSYAAILGVVVTTGAVMRRRRTSQVTA